MNVIYARRAQLHEACKRLACVAGRRNGPHENATPAFSNFSGLKSVFENICFRDRLGLVGLTVEIKLRFQISPCVKRPNLATRKRFNVNDVSVSKASIRVSLSSFVSVLIILCLVTSAMCRYGCGTGECFRPGVCRCPNGAYSPSCSGVQAQGLFNHQTRDVFTI